jgi:uncharacterized protein YndB with AHSA1/START domain
MPTSTIRLHRVLRAPIARVYRAFLDAEVMAIGWQESLAQLAKLVEPEIPD